MESVTRADGLWTDLTSNGASWVKFGRKPDLSTALEKPSHLKAYLTNMLNNERYGDPTGNDFVLFESKKKTKQKKQPCCRDITFPTTADEFRPWIWAIETETDRNICITQYRCYKYYLHYSVTRWPTYTNVTDKMMHASWYRDMDRCTLWYICNTETSHACIWPVAYHPLRYKCGQSIQASYDYLPFRVSQFHSCGFPLPQQLSPSHSSGLYFKHNLSHFF